MRFARVMIAGFGLSGLVIGLSYLGATNFRTEKYDRSLMAAWLQSIGAIGAIVGTAWAVHYQANRTSSDRRRAIFAVADAAAAHAASIDRWINSETPRHSLLMHYHSSILESAHMAMSTAPVHELESRDAVNAFLFLRDQLVFLRLAIDRFADGPDNDPMFGKTLRETREHNPGNVTAVTELRVTMDSILKKNVTTHLARIQHEHKALQAALSYTRAEGQGRDSKATGDRA